MTAVEFNKCVDLYADNIYRFILKNIKDKEQAKDIVQDTYEKLWLKVNEVESTNAKSYMFTTAYRTMIDLIRREKFKGNYDETKVEAIKVSNTYKGEKDALNIALERLPEIQRIVILLRDYEGYNYFEIGEITGLTESQVKVYIYRARVTLKEFIVKLENVI
jgi:RNA polymerase sigma-70 factor (ECF subfamily)